MPMPLGFPERSPMAETSPGSSPIPGRTKPPSVEIDRISPTLHPQGRLVMRQKWRDLLFLHWQVPVESLRPLIPPQLELDLYNGTAYVGLVPFRMRGVRPIGLPAVPWLSNFHETNVRTYVHFQGSEPGVWFFSLDAANYLAVWLARAWFHLPYHFARMFVDEESGSPDPAAPIDGARRDSPVVYAGVRHQDGSPQASYCIRALPIGVPRASQPGTLEHFLAERYILYTLRKDRLHRGYVHHPPYPLQPAQVLSVGESLLAANGLHPFSEPPIAHFARGVDVRVFNLQEAKNHSSFGSSRTHLY